MAIAIRPLQSGELTEFFDYLNDHLSDNGRDGPLFQPLSRSQIGFPASKAATFSRGITTEPGQQGWRRVWIAHNEAGIMGHIDLRSRAESGASHRALLGMGVHRAARRTGVGTALLNQALDWARSQGLEWIDLEVLAGNAPARALYRQCGFVQTGEIADMFRIDGESLGYAYMSLALAPQAVVGHTD